MTVTALTQKTGARPAARLTCTWVPVRGQDGRTHMEMRWVEQTAARPVEQTAARPHHSTRPAA